MLTLKQITKDYITGDETVHALRGVSLHFRPHEFVAILGPSGCGKTTLLNIIGGLDHYTDGDLVINNTSTKEYRDKDWDSYRNHRVGFVFQSYNLIPHQTVLANVELALTLSGVGRGERHARAAAALASVGLEGQLKKKPNQMSGGQMQRVAIARALVNDPDIILADEPTGALDTVTSTQIMDILRSISDRKLIVMVTHNPEIAEEYATRIIRVRDGLVVEDSNPYDGVSEELPAPASNEEVPVSQASACDTGCDAEPVVVTDAPAAEASPAAPAGAVEQPKRSQRKQKREKTSMSLLTAFSLSLNNLLTKKARTFLTSFAGSIGIIGIALILALSNGIQLFIDQVQEDTLSTYPLSIMEQTQDFSAMLGAMTEVGQVEDHRDSNMIWVDDSMGTMMSALNKVQKNNLERFKAYIDANYDKLEPYLSAIQYTYQFDLQVYSGDGKTQVNPTTIFQNMGDSFTGVNDLMDASGMTISAMSEMIDNRDLLNQQYDVVAGSWPTNANEIVLVISKNNQISKMSLYMLGVLDQGEIADIIEAMMKGEEVPSEPMDPYRYDDFLGKQFYLLNTSDYYFKTDRTYPLNGTDYPIWNDIRETPAFKSDDKTAQATFVTENGVPLKISGIIRPREDATAASIATNLAYTKELTDLVLAMNLESEVIAQQKATPTHNVTTGLEFKRTEYTPENIDQLIDTIEDEMMQYIYDEMTKMMHDYFTKTPPVNDTNTFLGFVNVMTPAQQLELLTNILAIANEVNPTAVSYLCASTGETGLSDASLSVTPDNLVRVYPILTPEKQMLAVMGLATLCGEEKMQGIYDYMNAQITAMRVNDDNFKQFVGIIAYDEESFRALVDALYAIAPQTDATLDTVLEDLGDAVLSKPASINFYAIDFESKDRIVQFIADYNNSVEEADQMKYTDVVGMLMSSITTILNVITYVLVAFVAISLIVSSIMIGIITYISVLERIKEIGILRAIGASKGNVAQVFLAETAIVGFFAGVIGIVSTLVLCIPTNLIIRAASGFENISAVLPFAGAFALIAISMVLTLVAGVLPALLAAKKEPVDALRSE